MPRLEEDHAAGQLALQRPATDTTVKGPFTLSYRQGGWVISDGDGLRMVELTGCLVNGSSPSWAESILRSYPERAADAQFVVDAMNAAWRKRVLLANGFGKSPLREEGTDA